MTESELGYNTMINLLVRMIIVLFNLAGNSLILAVVRRSQNFSRVTRHLIGHVAVADIGFGCTMTVHAFLTLSGAMNYPACLAITTIGNITGLSSCWGIFVVLLDNYLSVRLTGQAEAAGLSLPKARWCILSGWTLIGMLLMVFLLEAPKDITASSCSPGDQAHTHISMLSLAVFGLLLSCATIFLLLLTVYTVTTKMNTLFEEGTHMQNLLRQRNLKIRARIIRLFAIIAVGFIISWCPISIAVCVRVLCTDGCGITEDHLKLLSSFMAVNAMLNVMVYITKDKKFRQDAKRAMCRINQVAPQSNTVAVITAHAPTAANVSVNAISTRNAVAPKSAATVTTMPSAVT